MLKQYYKIIFWIIIIGISCFTPGNEFKEVKINIPHFDKIVHFGMFYILGILIKGNKKITRKSLQYFLLYAICYAIIIEMIQHFYIPMRNGDMVDFFADFLGLSIGVITTRFYPNFAKKILQ